MQIVTLYESAWSDGYRPNGDGRYYLNESLAFVAAKQKEGNYATSPLKHKAVQGDDGEYYLLKSETPVFIAGSEQEKEDLRRKIRLKLTAEEREILGMQ